MKLASRILLIPTFLSISFNACALGPEEAPEIWNMPDWVRSKFRTLSSLEDYKPISRINPFYLRGDFNGDDKPDIAVLIENIETKKQGIAIFHYDEDNIYIVGAGRSLRIGGDDYSFMDMWCVYRGGTPERGVEESSPPKIQHEALYIGKSESMSAIIYWSGKRYKWYHQGD